MLVCVVLSVCEGRIGARETTVCTLFAKLEIRARLPKDVLPDVQKLQDTVYRGI